MLHLNLSYAKCFLPEPVSQYLCGLPRSLVDLCLSGTQVYNAEILIRALTQLTHLQHLRMNGLTVITDTSLEKVSHSTTENRTENCDSIVDTQRSWLSIEDLGTQWLYHVGFSDGSCCRTYCSLLSGIRTTVVEFTKFHIDIDVAGPAVLFLHPSIAITLAFTEFIPKRKEESARVSIEERSSVI